MGGNSIKTNYDHVTKEQKEQEELDDSYENNTSSSSTQGDTTESSNTALINNNTVSNEATTSIPSTFTITGTVVDKIPGSVVYVQVDNASDGLPTGVSYTLTFTKPSKGFSAYDYGVTEPEIGQNVTVYGEWEQGKNYGNMDANYRSIIPMDITINS